MKYFAIIILLLSYSCSSSNNNSDNELKNQENEIPELKAIEVAELFADNYGLAQGYRATMIKREDGYYLSLLAPQSQKGSDEYKITDGNGELKMNLEFDGLAEPQLMPNLSAMFINFNVIRNGSIDAVPVHGYSGWAYDAIQILEGKSKLTPNDMYGLARAYDHISIQKRAKQLAPDEKITTYEYEKSGNMSLLTTESLKEFEQDANRAIEAYKTLADNHPDHPTAIGSANNKYANTIMDFHLTARYRASKDFGNQGLDEINYSDAVLNHSKNLLASCPEGTILFTYGDNDTYPLLYLQMYHNFRADVIIMNTSLLSLFDYYAQFIDIDSLNHTLPLSFIESKEAGYFYVNNSPGTVSLSEIRNAVEINPDISTDIYSFIGSKISLRSNTIEVNLKRSFLRADLVVYDLIDANPDRTFAFAKSSTHFFGLNAHLSDHGMVHIMQDEHHIERDIPINFESAFNNYTKTYVYEGLNSAKGFDNNIANNYLYQLGSLRLELISENKLDSADIINELIEEIDFKPSFLKHQLDLSYYNQMDALDRAHQELESMCDSVANEIVTMKEKDEISITDHIGLDRRIKTLSNSNGVLAMKPDYATRYKSKIEDAIAELSSQFEKLPKSNKLQEYLDSKR